MGDLNPNRANEILTLADGGGTVDLVTGGSPAIINTTQHGNAIMCEFSGTVINQISADDNTAILKTTPGTTDLEARMVPGGTPIVPFSLKVVANTDLPGVIVSATNNTAVLDISASVMDNTYNDWTIKIIAGTGAGQSRNISSYAGGSRTASISPDWTTIPNTTSDYELFRPGNTDKWVTTTVQVSNPSTSVIQFALVPPNNAWPTTVDAPLPSLDINTSQIKFMALAQSGRDYQA
jgi:hypothetical protein